MATMIHQPQQTCLFACQLQDIAMDVAKKIVSECVAPKLEIETEKMGFKANSHVANLVNSVGRNKLHQASC